MSATQPEPGPRRLGLALAVIATAQLMVVLDNTHSCANRVPRVPVSR